MTLLEEKKLGPRYPEPSSFIVSRYTGYATPDSYTNNHLLVVHTTVSNLHEATQIPICSKTFFNPVQQSVPGVKAAGAWC